jgi:acetyl esterase
VKYADKKLEALALRPSPFGDKPDVEEARAGLAERAAQKQPGPEMDSVRNIEVGGLPARLYRPRSEPLPLILYLHVGGWTVGGIDSSDRLCRRLAVAGDAAALSLDSARARAPMARLGRRRGGGDALDRRRTRGA